MDLTWLLLSLVALASIHPSPCAGRRLERIHALPDGWEQLDDGAPQPSAPFRLSVALRQPQVHELRRRVAAGRVPASDIKALRQPAPEDVEVVRRWLRDGGIAEAAAAEKNGWIHVDTTVGAAEKLLDMQLRRYSFRGGHPVLRSREYSVPDSLAPMIHFVHPVANFVAPRPLRALSRLGTSGRRAASKPSCFSCAAEVVPKCILRKYNISYTPPDGKSSIRLGVPGFLEQFANFEDTQKFLRRTRPNLTKTGYNFSVELANGGSNSQAKSEAGQEADADVQYTMAIGYPAQVVFYSIGGQSTKLDDRGRPTPQQEPPDPFNANEPYVQLLEFLLDKPDDEIPHVLSLSYGDDEISVPRRYAERVCDMIGMLTARGTSFIGGSGDGGARGARNATCRTNDGTDRDVAIATFPATCPWVTSVGAVTNARDAKGADFSTGGFSQIFKRESWQDEAVDGYVKALDGYLENLYDPAMRAIPDISVVGTEYFNIIGGKEGFSNGTSLSTPVFAAMIALVNDARVRKGKDVLGWLNDKLYSDKVRSVLKDVTGGQSQSCILADGSEPGGWPAKEGWDAITGLGTPDNFDDLLRVLVDM
ncbi:hypothetical protein CDD83_5946 [Cordyceps sp. RAO-2017]|nr:hypothetical protein CDD83_5946 [Cordyceps sp. RAO-2017]